MSTTYRCTCTNAAADVCTGDDALVAREPDGSCGCSCHIEYADDPENWQPITMFNTYTNAERMDDLGWLERIKDAERVADEQGLWT